MIQRKLSIVVIGDEILIGQVCDTNSGAIARAFGPEGWLIDGVSVAADSPDSIRRCIEQALQTSDLVVTTGGLGPTKDDITKGVLMEIFGGRLIHDPSVAENIRDVFNKRGLAMNRLTETQALVPDSCRIVQNRFGTAPIMWFERDGKSLIAMPGVPFETEGMLPEVLRLVNERYAPGRNILHHTVTVSGITESALAERLADYEAGLSDGLHLAYLPEPGLIRLRLDGHDVSVPVYLDAVKRLKSAVDEFLLFDGGASVAEMLLKLLREKGFTCATAESCTGGSIARAITAIPGASDSMLGGIVSYANSVKIGLLDVGKDTIQRQGAVSREVVEQMAAGACRATGADCAVATSGVAGPGGGSPDKPVGTVWIAWAVDGRVSSRVFHLPGNRQRVVDRAVSEAIIGLFKCIKSLDIQ